MIAASISTSPNAFIQRVRTASGFDSRRATQLWRALYQDKRWIRSMSDADHSAQPFAAAFKAAVAESASLSGALTLQSVSTARDGTHKLVFALNDGEGAAAGGNVETVLIPMRNRWVSVDWIMSPADCLWHGNGKVQSIVTALK
eukprot:GHUV01023847.1.p2 GENE.GHUV01023847.1~~GHUV01023847.1.p2  ORF type:complete len:144 (-),score=26.25 GHUV01023847.1:188-619(-)